MTKTQNNVIDGALMFLTGGISISMIQQILGVILLVLDVAWIISKGVYAVYKHLKEKRYEEAIKAIKDTSDELEEYKESVRDDNDQL